MTLIELAGLLGLNLILILAVMGGLWALTRGSPDVSFIDGVWPLAILLLALVTFPRTDGDPVRKGLLLWLCAVWALRLGWHLLERWRRHGQDTRHAALLEAGARDHGWSADRTTLVLLFLPQAVLAWGISLPVQLGQVAAVPPIGWIGWIGAGIVVFGIGLASIGDAQLAAFHKDPDHRHGMLETGLRRYTRHPGYFGDACVWWGLWLIAAETGWVGVVSIVGPVFLTFTLRRWAGIGGAPAVESTSGHGDYVRRTSAFLPRPPKD